MTLGSASVLDGTLDSIGLFATGDVSLTRLRRTKVISFENNYNIFEGCGKKVFVRHVDYKGVCALDSGSRRPLYPVVDVVRDFLLACVHM